MKGHGLSSCAKSRGVPLHHSSQQPCMVQAATVDQFMLRFASLRIACFHKRAGPSSVCNRPTRNSPALAPKSNLTSPLASAPTHTRHRAFHDDDMYNITDILAERVVTVMCYVLLPALADVVPCGPAFTPATTRHSRVVTLPYH